MPRKTVKAHPSPNRIAFDLIDITEVCSMLGGSKPLNPATIYREITRGNLPKGVLVAPNSVRWDRSWIAEKIAAAFARSAA